LLCNVLKNEETEKRKIKERIAPSLFISLHSVPYKFFAPPMYYLRSKPDSNEIRNNTTKMKNRILAMDAAPAAMPPNPKTAAITATIKKISAQRNIS
jgi:hypothetical protein